MKKIIVMSDTHGLKNAVQYIKDTYTDADLIIHCGDICLPKDYAKDLFIVCGNCDDPSLYESVRIYETEGHRILVTHGHMFFDSIFVNYNALARFAKRNECDIVCYGHSHIYDDRTVDGIRLLNPGSMNANRDMSNPSYIILTIDGDKVTTERKDYFGL